MTKTHSDHLDSHENRIRAWLTVYWDRGVAVMLRIGSALSAIACVVCLPVSMASAQVVTKAPPSAEPQAQMPAVDGVNSVFETAGGSSAIFRCGDLARSWRSRSAVPTVWRSAGLVADSTAAGSA